MPDRNQGQTFPVRLAVGQREYTLGTVTGTTGDEVSESLADLLADVARELRGPEVTPAPPCEGCGVEMVYRRNPPLPGDAGRRFTVVARDPATGEPSIFGVHHVGLCCMDSRLAAEARA